VPASNRASGGFKVRKIGGWGAIALLGLATVGPAILGFPCEAADLPEAPTLAAALDAPSDLIPWDPEDVLLPRQEAPVPTGPSGLTSAAALWLIHKYQTGVSTHSIQRCPFHISCSNFALEAIKRHGFLVGLCMFVDRNLYRENPGAYAAYDLIETSAGALKLDDRFFLGDLK
jgi:putative component of membrane protein insertase Oxa1/YidC/SpoIIIJ protein YidD